ncbi:MAG: ATP-grasp domain-containing protein [Bacteroidetes bacterium]|nr:ATP-grasp domain-containing protein [Bacteroidota bacterium]
MKVCVLQPDYSTTAVDYKYYDPPRNLSLLLSNSRVDHVFLNKLTTYKQLKELSKQGYDIFVNLCEGYPEWEVPGVDVVYSLESLNLPFTGPSSATYDLPKALLKYVAYCEDVPTPTYVLLEKEEDMHTIPAELKFPLFIKPAHAGDSLGVNEESLVNNRAGLEKKCKELLPLYGNVLVEQYIEGREFTVLVAANQDGKSCTSYKPVEYIFPSGKSFKTYSLKTSELHPSANIPCSNEVLENKLRTASEKIFKTAGGHGYGRLDFRVDKEGNIFFLEINLTCSVFYTDGYEGSADFILKYDPAGQSGFLQHIIAEGIARHARKQRPFYMKGNSIAGYGIYAKQTLQPGQIVFVGEGRSQRLITKREVDQNWNEEEKLLFRRYAYPISEEVYVLWDNNPADWAPQNHSCDANTIFDGLNVITTRMVAAHEELTLDYAKFLDATMEPFTCGCGSPKCRGKIAGTINNTLTTREQKKRR